MSIEIRVPQLPESIADATLVAWPKKPGEPVSRDENLADLETDKVVLEVPAPANGVVRELRVQSGATVTSGQVLALLEEGAAAQSVGTSAAAPATAAAAPAAAAPAAAPTRAAPPAASRAEPAPEAAAGNGDAARQAGKLSPSVRRLVEENRLDPTSIPASGRDGRLTKSDVILLDVSQ